MAWRGWRGRGGRGVVSPAGCVRAADARPEKQTLISVREKSVEAALVSRNPAQHPPFGTRNAPAGRTPRGRADQNSDAAPGPEPARSLREASRQSRRLRRARPRYTRIFIYLFIYNIVTYVGM